jgi:lipoprotein-anchoring transpeptidase ErfK/SrfK
MRIIAAIIVAVAVIGATAPGQAGAFSKRDRSKVVATVSLSQQVMVLDVTDRIGKRVRHVWPVSTGKPGFETPTGSWRASWMAKDHVSDTYDNSPMPNSVFFTPGYAIHGTDAVSRLGRPASHGCVRLAPQNAETFYELVAQIGMARTQIVVGR